MNVQLPFRMTETTQAADGLPRRRWTTAEILQLVELGVFHEDDRFELVGGEIVLTSPKSVRHEVVKAAVARHLTKICPNSLDIVAETTLYQSADDFREPDILIWPAKIQRVSESDDVALAEVTLLIEVAGTSRAYDLGAKADYYARNGLREYWVIDADTLATTVGLNPSQDGFGERREVHYSDIVTPSLAPELAICLSNLGLQPLSET